MSSGIKTELLNKQYLMTNKIYTDLNEKKAINIENCNNPLVCIQFTFQDGTVKKLQVDETNKTITYDDYTIKLNNESYFKTMDISTYSSASNNKIFNANIPIYNDLFKNTDFGINIVYPYNDTEVTNNYGNKFIVFDESQIETLPYIETDGNQYIDTGIKATQNTGFDIDFITYNDVTKNSGKYVTILGARKDLTLGFQLSTWGDGSPFHGHMFFGNNPESEEDLRYNAGIISNTRQQIKLKNRILTLPDNTTTTLTNYEFETPTTLTVFGLYTLDGNVIEKSTTRLYNLKIYNGDTVIMNLTPAKDKNTNRIGLYDTVSKRFFLSNGDSEFLYD